MVFLHQMRLKMDRNGLKWTQKGLTWIKRDKNCVLEEKIPFSSNFYGGNEGTPHPFAEFFGGKHLAVFGRTPPLPHCGKIYQIIWQMVFYQLPIKLGLVLWYPKLHRSFAPFHCCGLLALCPCQLGRANPPNPLPPKCNFFS